MPVNRTHQLQLDRPVQVIELVEQPASGTERNGHHVHLDLIELSARMSA